ncbi:MAG: 4-hydroxythreonine-4-phosphate dehydrogenase PdxA [Bacillota bacterium]|nr:4-hydroxythreonine-4-phosphate dehydrogenase PdxA [Bacillota bacterium]
MTIGDPAGIGPEVVARAVLHPAVLAACRPVVYGTPEVVQAAMRLVEGTQERGHGEPVSPDIVPAPEMVPVPGPRPGEFVPGRVSGPCGAASFAYLERAAADVLAGKADALATAPLNKEATALAGYSDIGHLEFLTRLTGTRESATVLVAGTLRCLHLTTHKSLGDAVAAVKRELVLARLRLAQREMARFGSPRPRIAVAALNPHGGEGGLFGREEMDEIAPAVAEARTEGIDAAGPLAADSMLALATGGMYDLVLVMYHDQGHIAVKVHDMARSYTVAFGLPLVRTSVDHGTAFDLAWQGRADARSMVAAIIAAAHLARGNWPDPAALGG